VKYGDHCSYYCLYKGDGIIYFSILAFYPKKIHDLITKQRVGMQILEQLAAFKKSTASAIEQLNNTTDIEGYYASLLQHNKSLNKLAIDIGDAHDTAPMENMEDADLSKLVAHYKLSNAFKSYLILWKNAFYEAYKSHILANSEKVDAKAITQLKEKTAEVLGAAHDELQKTLAAIIDQLNTNPKVKEQFIETCFFEDNPWPTYRAQLENLNTQIIAIDKSHESLLIADEQFSQVKDVYTKLLARQKTELIALEQQAIAIANQAQEGINPTKISLTMENLEAHNSELGLDFEAELGAQTPYIVEKTTAYLDASEGLLSMKETMLRKNSKTWLEAEINPLMVEIKEIVEELTYSLKITLSNVKNRSLLASNDDEDITQKEGINIVEPINVFLKKIKVKQRDVDQLEIEINQKLNEELSAAMLLNPTKPFLPITFQSTINQYWVNQSSWISEAQQWVKKQWHKAIAFSAELSKEESLSKSEKIARVLKAKRIESINKPYASIFLTKGFLGTSFTYGRTQEVAQVEQQVEQWKQGYRGALLLHGNRFCGKTVFGELIANHFFHQKTIKLTPNSQLRLEGRKHNTTTDLKETLDFVTKYAEKSKYLIWIDDLELWNSPEVLMSTNLRNLSSTIDSFSNKFFFITSMSTWSLNYFKKGYDLKNVYQSTIDLSKMETYSIAKAILTRHGATHKTLIGESGEELSSDYFKKTIRQIASNTKNNIGDALHHWATAIDIQPDSEKVIFDYNQPFTIPDFIESTNGMLLKTVYMHKKINEYQLNKIFGAAFNQKYRNTLLRLINTGVLVRDKENFLEVNEVIVNELSQYLKSAQYISAN